MAEQGTVGGSLSSAPVPRVVDTDEWAHVERGIVQRVRVIETFLADVYGPQEAIRDGVLPAATVSSCRHFHRRSAGIVGGNGIRAHVVGIDVIRDEDGHLRVLGGDARRPRGLADVVANRGASTRALPEMSTRLRIRPVDECATRLARALRAAAPHGVTDPTVVVLAPGGGEPGADEDTRVATLIGADLVEACELHCADGRVWRHTASGRQRVDVIHRRIDDDQLGPAHARPDATLRALGLLAAARSGRVTIANAVGNGVADDRLIYTYLPDLIRYYTGDEPILDNVDTWRLDEPVALEEVLDRLDELIVKPVDASTGARPVIGPDATPRQLSKLSNALLHDPRGWIAQSAITSAPAATRADDMLASSCDLRVFAINSGDDTWVLPGGLTRVGDELADTWVLSDPSQAGLR